MPKLTGNNKCQCGACKLYFGSVYAFDKHRVGGHGDRGCLPLSSLVQNGWREDDKGFWRTPRREDVDKGPNWEEEEQ